MANSIESGSKDKGEAPKRQSGHVQDGYVPPPPPALHKKGEEKGYAPPPPPRTSSGKKK